MNPTHESPTLDIDAIIDRVARGMTTAEPARDMRARVLSRIGDRPSRARGLTSFTGLTSLTGRWLPIMTLAASTVIIIGTWALWPHAARPNEPAPVMVAQTEPVVTPASNDVTATAPTARVPRLSVVNRPAPELMSEAEMAWHARAVPALSGPSALAIEPLEQSGVTIAPIDIKPLVTEPLVFKSSGDGREIPK